jgi:hypothetical protein
MWVLVDRNRISLASGLHMSEVNRIGVRVPHVQEGDPKPEVLDDERDVIADAREDLEGHRLAPDQNHLIVEDVDRGTVLRDLDEDASGIIVVLVEAPARLDVDGLEVGDDQVLDLEVGGLRGTHCSRCDCACVICLDLLLIRIKNESIFLNYLLLVSIDIDSIVCH